MSQSLNLQRKRKQAYNIGGNHGSKGSNSCLMSNTNGFQEESRHGYIPLYPGRSPKSLGKDVVCTSQIHTPKRERVQTSRTKFSLRGRGCNIPGFGVTKIEETDVCIAFMHRKSGEFSRFQIKLTTVTEVSLDLLELK